MLCSLYGITRMYIDVLEKCATFLGPRCIYRGRVVHCKQDIASMHRFMRQATFLPKTWWNMDQFIDFKAKLSRCNLAVITCTVHTVNARHVHKTITSNH